jgi:hemerythrin-like domain-containing protein
MDAFFPLSVLRDEHRQLAAVIRSLEYLTRDAVYQGAKLDVDLIAVILNYIEAFPNRFHHPKEDEYLFKALRRSSAAAGEVLDDLEAEHARDGELIRELRDLLSQCRAGGPAVEAFATATAKYADFYWAHMRKEEDIVMPLAERTVGSADWQALEDALRASDDLTLAREEFRGLFRMIVKVAPPAVVRLLASVSA